jgi:O-antigen ligase
MSEPVPPAAAGEVSYGSWMRSMWLFTVLRFGLFFALWGLLVLVGLHGFFAALVALVLSVPLSFVLLARPRQAFARQLEARLAARTAHRADLDAELDPDA